MLHQTRRIAQASAALGVRHYAQAPALTSATGSGFLGGLFGGSSPSAPPMTVPLQGVPTFEYDTTKPAPTTAIGVLGNGVKIAAQEAAVRAVLLLPGDVLCFVASCRSVPAEYFVHNVCFVIRDPKRALRCSSTQGVRTRLLFRAVYRTCWSSWPSRVPRTALTSV